LNGFNFCNTMNVMQRQFDCFFISNRGSSNNFIQSKMHQVF
jgi:hypothetical protein